MTPAPTFFIQCWRFSKPARLASSSAINLGRRLSRGTGRYFHDQDGLRQASCLNFVHVAQIKPIGIALLGRWCNGLLASIGQCLAA